MEIIKPGAEWARIDANGKLVFFDEAACRVAAATSLGDHAAYAKLCLALIESKREECLKKMKE
jgi:hypothetical protein